MREEAGFGAVDVEFVVGVSGEDMEVVVEDVLLAGGSVVLAESDAVAVVGYFHGEGDFLGDFEDAVADFLGEIVEVFKVLVGDDDDVAFAGRNPEGVDEGGDEIVFVNEVGLFDKYFLFGCVDVFG